MREPTLRLKPLWLTIGFGLVGSVVWLSLTGSPPKIDVDFDYLDKVEHSFAYAVMMGWFMQIYPAPSGRLALAFAFVAMGILLEVLQGMGGVRTFDYGDMGANIVGVLIAMAVIRPSLSRVFYNVERLVLGSR